MLRAQRMAGLDGLRSLRAAWESLHAGAGLHARYEWHAALAASWYAGQAVAYLQVLDGGRTVSILPMIPARKVLPPFGSLPVLGLGTREELADFPVAPGVAFGDLAASVTAALAAWPEPWEALRWPRALQSSNVMRLAAAFDPAAVRVADEESCNRLDVAAPFERVEQRWSKNLRHSLARSRRRLEESGGMRVTRSGVLAGPPDGRGADAAEIARAYESFVALEASGWKGARGTAIARSTERTAFLAELLELRGPDFAPEVRLLWRGNKPIAGEFTVAVDGCLHVLKIGYDEAEGRFSPGQVLLAAVVQDACARGLGRVSLVTDMPWHASWRPEPERAFEVTVFRQARRARVHKAVLAIRRAAREAMPRWLARRGRRKDDAASKDAPSYT